jgi:large subunit ribosomal protein L35e
MPKHLKPKDLKTKSRGDLLEELAKLEKKLFELRGQIGSSSSAEKLSNIRTVRKDVARVKTVLMEQQRAALKEKYATAAFKPKDIRPHVVKSKRRALAPKWQNWQNKTAWRRSKFLKPIKFALKAPEPA